MKGKIVALALVATGAFYYWLISGFDGSYNNYMSSYSDNDWKYFKNLFTGLLIIVLIGSFVIALVSAF